LIKSRWLWRQNRTVEQNRLKAGSKDGRREKVLAGRKEERLDWLEAGRKEERLELAGRRERRG
jgi:hypothetical protein